MMFRALLFPRLVRRETAEAETRRVCAEVERENAELRRRTDADLAATHATLAEIAERRNSRTGEIRAG